MKQYLNLCKDILKNGIEKKDRTGVGTISVFGRQLRFDLQKGFPILTTKKIWWKGVVGELLWMLKGDTNIKFLNDNGIHIWDDWADEKGNLGPIYGKQWRNWKSPDPEISMVSGETFLNYKSIDQIKNLIEKLKQNPDDRRMIVSAWNVGEIEKMKLPPCHLLYQFYVTNNKLSCQLYQRSADIAIGAPTNIPFYSILTHTIAQVCNMKVGEFIWVGGDCHIYKNHIDGINEQIKRKPYKLPKLELNLDIKDIDSFDFEDIKLKGYKYHPKIKFEIAV